MNNEIVYISRKDMTHILEQNLRNPKVYVVEIDGKTIKTPYDYYSLIEKELKFPFSCNMNIDSYLDWITDLSWLDNYEELCIVVHNSSEFMSNDVSTKDMILQDFENIIFPYWENDVEKFCVDGRKKKFNLYMIK